MSGRRLRCSAKTGYATYNSARRDASGERRFLSGVACMNPARYRDVDGDGWCVFHAQRLIRQRGDTVPWLPFVDIKTGEVLRVA